MMWNRRFLSWIAPVLLLAQFALAVHQLEHRIAPDVLTSAHECVLCNVTGGATPPPAPIVILPPDRGPDVRISVIAQAPCCGHAAAAFLSRAPPISAAL